MKKVKPGVRSVMCICKYVSPMRIMQGETITLGHPGVSPKSPESQIRKSLDAGVTSISWSSLASVPTTCSWFITVNTDLANMAKVVQESYVLPHPYHGQQHLVYPGCIYTLYIHTQYTILYTRKYYGPWVGGRKYFMANNSATNI